MSETRCENCGCKSFLSCAACNRPICNDCYHCGDSGKVCGLCRDEEIESKRVFDSCNVCGIKIRTKEEDKMGMCERCASE